jgi:molybdopterin converting factor small subunit
LKITLYGKLGEAVGREIAFDDMPGRTVAHLRRTLAERHPALAADLLSPRVRACVNDALVGEDWVLSRGDELALLPPVSGG